MVKNRQQDLSNAITRIEQWISSSTQNTTVVTSVKMPGIVKVTPRIDNVDETIASTSDFTLPELDRNVTDR